MNYFDILITACGGFGLFIFGMHVMASGLQKAAGNKMQSLLEALTKTKFMSVLVGAGVTAIIQSSSATTVMVVGFVNAGIMNLQQSVGVIMGANIGTTATAWLVSSSEWAKFLSPHTIAPLLIMVGAVLVLFFKSEKTKDAGEMLAGLGMLFIGMQMMSNGLAPLSESETFRQIFTSLGNNPLYGLLAGAAVTAIIQSSSASIGILQSLAFIGLIPWNAAVYIIMGQNIGTCVTTLLSSIGTSKNAKSAAFIHLLFNIIGSIIFSVIAVIYFVVINKSFGNNLISGTEISIVHTMFNILSTVILYPFSGFIVNLSKKMASASGVDEVDETNFVHLDDRMLKTPSFALQNCVREIVRLSRMTYKNLVFATESLFEHDEEKLTKIFKREKNIDLLDKEITKYLVKLCNENISEDENRIITGLMHINNDIERIGDHAENIAEITQFIHADNVKFSDLAISELKLIIETTLSCYENSIDALENNNLQAAKEVKKQEDYIDDLERTYRSGHITRLKAGECDASTGIVFLDVITNLERISDHALNIAEIILGEK